MNFEFTETMTYDQLNETVNSMLPKNRERLISFSIFEDAGQNENDQWLVKIPNILSDKPVFQGTYNFLVDYWRVCSVAKMSPPVTNPTWKDIIVHFNELLQDGDRCGVFLEGLNLNDDNTISFAVGS